MNNTKISTFINPIIVKLVYLNTNKRVKLSLEDTKIMDKYIYPKKRLNE